MVSKLPWHSIGRLALVFFCLVAVLILAILILPISLDITALRGPVEEALTSFIEAPTTVEQVRLRPSLWPTLTVQGIEIQGTGWEDAPLFSRIGLVEVKVSLIPLLRRRLRVKRLFASDLEFHPHHPEDAKANWPVWTELDYEISELADIELERVNVFLDDYELGQTRLLIDRLFCDIATNRPLDMSLEGTLDGEPLALTAGGPTLMALPPRASDFPLVAHLDLSGVQVDLDGAVSRQPDGTRFRFAVRANSPELEFLRPLTDRDLPEIGGFELNATISNRDARLDLRELEGRIGTSAVRGSLSLDSRDGRPLIEGRISLDQLDLEPWLSSGSETVGNQTAPLGFSNLMSVDADLELAIGRIDGFDQDLERITTRIDLTAGKLIAPVKLTAASLPIAAQLVIDVNAEMPEVSAEARLENVDLAQLESLLELDERLTGDIGVATLNALTKGETLENLVASLDAQLEIRHANLIIADPTGEEPIEVRLDHTRIQHRVGEPLAITADGTLFETPFSLALQTASPKTLLATNTWPIDLSLSGAGADLSLAGAITRLDTGLDLDLGFDLAGGSLGELADWLGVSSQARYAYHLQGHITSRGSDRRLDLQESILGRSQFQGSIAWQAGSSETPVAMDLQATTLDLRELQELFDPLTQLDSDEETIGFDLPILPSQHTFRDADIELSVARLLRRNVDLNDLEISFRFREGRLERSPFSFNHDARGFAGAIVLDLRGEVPRFSLSVSGGGDALGELLSREQIVQGHTLTADKMTFKFDAAGRTIHQLVRSADISGQLDNVHWQFQLPEIDQPLDLRFERVMLSGPRNQPITIEAEGSLDKQPLSAHLELRIQEQLLDESGKSVPFRMQVDIAATDLQLAGDVHLPISELETELQIQLSGEDLSTLAPIMGMALPAFGPYHLNGRLSVTESAYSLTDFDLRVAESELQGSVQYEAAGGRPQIVADLRSRHIRTIDFLPASETGDIEQETKPLKKTELNLEFLQNFDATINLDVEIIETGSGPVENLSLEATNDRGKVDIHIVQPKGRDDSAELKARVRPSESGLGVELRAVWDQRPYGLIADILNPGKAKGTFSLDLDLSSSGSTLDELLAGLEGQFDVADYPEDSSATILDLWGGGLLNSVLPIFNLGKESRVNCVVGMFVVEDGVMKPEMLILDSTRSRVRGKGTIDLPADRIQIRLKPRPKQRSLISLATPMVISGPLTDPSVRISKGGTAVTFFRFYLWVYTVWRDIFRTPLPADGSDICVDPFRRNKP